MKPSDLDSTTANLVCALVTLMDAIQSGAPDDFLDAACRDAAIAIHHATGADSIDDLDAGFFTWGPTVTALQTQDQREACEAEGERIDDLIRAYRE